MRNATKTVVVVVSALAAVLAVAVAAFAGAGTLQGKITITPVTGGHYGDELTIAPSMNTTAYPGDTVDIQYLAADNTWQKYGESLAVEDTTSPDPASGLTTVGPLAFIVDDSLDYPAVLRAVFMPKDSSEGTCASDPVWLRMTRNASTHVTISGPSTVASTTSAVLTNVVHPVSGVGTVRMTIKRILARHTTLMQTYNLTTDDAGTATFTFKRTVKGRYRVTARFLGNRFGAASGVTTKYIVVK